MHIMLLAQDDTRLESPVNRNQEETTRNQEETKQKQRSKYRSPENAERSPIFTSTCSFLIAKTGLGARLYGGKRRGLLVIGIPSL